MAAKVHSLGMTAPITPMLPTSPGTVMHVVPHAADGSVMTTTLVPVYDAAGDPSVVLDPSIDPTGMSCGVKPTGVNGDPVVTATLTNADGTVATGKAPFHIAPTAPTDVADLSVTVDPPA
jgi:hypothetical protein